jgi:hypothetical protein
VKAAEEEELLNHNFQQLLAQVTQLQLALAARQQQMAVILFSEQLQAQAAALVKVLTLLVIRAVLVAVQEEQTHLTQAAMEIH